MIDDTALPKKGTHSVGVAPQYAGVLGKQANCQSLVSLTLAKDEVPVPIVLRLFLPEKWIKDPERLQHAGVPETILGGALQGRDRAGGTPAGHAGRRALRGGAGRCRLRHQRALPPGALGARAALGGGHPAQPEGLCGRCAADLPPPSRGRPRKTLVPDQEAIAAEAMLAKASWRRVTWRRGTKGPLGARFAAVRVRVADGPAVRLHGHAGQHLPGDEVWLVGEHRASGERKYYLSNLPPDTALKQLASLIKARWVCEQAHQQLKEELGLDHFEGRSWRGLHRHALDDADRLSVPAAPAFAGRHRGKKEKPADHRHNRACQLFGACCLIIWRTPCACDVRSAGPTSPLAQ